MTATEKKVAKLEKGFQVWDSLTPMERYNKVMVNFSHTERIPGLPHCLPR